MPTPGGREAPCAVQARRMSRSSSEDGRRRGRRQRRLNGYAANTAAARSSDELGPRGMCRRRRGYSGRRHRRRRGRPAKEPRHRVR